MKKFILTHELVDQVFTLRDKGMNILDIVEETGLSRFIVCKALNKGHEAVRKPEALKNKLDNQRSARSGETAYCEKCEATVIQPCVACKAREYKAANGPTPLEHEPISLTPVLTKECQKRFDELNAERYAERPSILTEEEVHIQQVNGEQVF